MPAAGQVPDAPAVILALLILGIFASGTVLWLRVFLRSGDGLADEAEEPVPPWRIGWVNFGLFLCLLVLAVFVVQQAGLALLGGPPEDGELRLTPWLAVAAVCLLQVPMLAVFAASRQLWPHLFGGPLNARPLRPVAALRQAFPLFLRYLPLVWLASLAWTMVLAGLRRAGALEEIVPQELVRLFAAGGDPVALGILALLAVVLAPLAEELVFRGCIYRFLKSQIPVFPAQVASGALFASLHVNLASFVPLVLLGVLLARLYERAGNIALPVVFHALFNGLTVLLLFLASRSAYGAP